FPARDFYVKSGVLDAVFRNVKLNTLLNCIFLQLLNNRVCILFRESSLLGNIKFLKLALKTVA
ncbi:MAG: hypothetical protein K1W14_09645, partial [Muribaculaceae bacterium]